MAEFLLAAEADKIQDLIFRSSHLREVVGGSQLLERFCTDAAPALLDHFSSSTPEAVISAGGAFRILFRAAAREEVDEFGRLLAEVYARALGGHLTVAVAEAEPGPGAVDSPPRYPALAEEAERLLRQAKEECGGAEAIAHLPVMALCASCGVALAESHAVGSRAELPEEANYICRACATKAAERHGQRRDFLQGFSEAMRQAGAGVPEGLRLPEVDVLSSLNAHRYVAYMVMDGNDLGALFSGCQSAAGSTRLSADLKAAVAGGLGAAAAQLWEWTRCKAPEHFPIIPLIMAGDDVFALLPAHWALDFARQFIWHFENRLKEATGQRVTAAAGVVVCKGSYPYALAHREATRLMEEAKRLGKRLAAEQHVRVSTISFAEIVGNRIAERSDVAQWPLCGSLRPYALARESLSPQAAEVVQDIDVLFRWRKGLRSVPGGRLKQLRALYADRPGPSNWDGAASELAAWNARLDYLLARIVHGDADRLCDLQQALGELGLPTGGTTASLGRLPEAVRRHRGYWRPLLRDQDLHLAHGLPDLLAMWDYAWLLHESPACYTGQEDER